MRIDYGSSGKLSWSLPERVESWKWTRLWSLSSVARQLSSVGSLGLRNSDGIPCHDFDYTGINLGLYANWHKSSLDWLMSECSMNVSLCSANFWPLRESISASCEVFSSLNTHAWPRVRLDSHSSMGYSTQGAVSFSCPFSTLKCWFLEWLLECFTRDEAEKILDDSLRGFVLSGFEGCRSSRSLAILANVRIWFNW